MGMPSLIRIAAASTIKAAGKSLDFSTNLSTVAAGKFKIKSSQMPKPPSGFGFIIEDIPGKDGIKLMKDFAGEKIIVDVYGLDLGETSVGLRVNVSKSNNAGSPKLTISSSVDYHDFLIAQVHFQDQGKHNQDELLFDQENLWKEFIRVRGLDDSIGRFLFDYMTYRRDREHSLFFSKLKEFVMS